LRILETRPEHTQNEQKEAASAQREDIDFVQLIKNSSQSEMRLPQSAAEKYLPFLIAEEGDGKNADRAKADSKAKDSVDLLLEKLGISMDQKTDPALINDILRDDMKLADCAPVLQLLGSKLTEPESMKPMLEKISTSIISKHPALHEMIDVGLNENLTAAPDEEGRKLIIRSLNHMVLLDVITRGMADDYRLMEVIRDHLMEKRKEYGVREGFLGSAYDIYRATGDLFEPAKAKTMDAAFNQYLEFRKKGEIDSSDFHMRRANLELNLAEAILTDGYHGFSDNARAGLYLAAHPFSRAWVAGDNRFVDYNFNQNWDSLYETWNMAFMAGNLSNPNILFPKLLIPQVIDAKPEEYLLNRSLALWLTINFDLFHKIEKKPEVILPNHKEIARRWGEINLAYGRMLDLHSK
jgi:hypothetical protein